MCCDPKYCIYTIDPRTTWIYWNTILVIGYLLSVNTLIQI